MLPPLRCVFVNGRPRTEWAQVVVGALILLAPLLLLFLIEGVSYGLHRLFHSEPLLWRVHAVHHMDRELDVTTSHRHHILEVVLFNHSSIYLPSEVDRVLGWFIATPKFHHVHHLSEQQDTNSNYGTVVPWFDHLFGTAKELNDEEQAGKAIGLEYLNRPGDTRIDRVLSLPLTWHRSVAGDGQVQGQPAAPQSSRST